MGDDSGGGVRRVRIVDAAVPSNGALRVEPCRDGEILRELRLRALGADGDAFLADHEAEAGWPPDRWRAELNRGDWVVAAVGGDHVGVACSRPREDGRHVEGVWVDPLVRRQGVATAMLGDILQREGRRETRRLLVWVLGDNPGAWALYLKAGFVATGESKLLREDPPLEERRLVIDATRSRDSHAGGLEA